MPISDILCGSKLAIFLPWYKISPDLTLTAPEMERMRDDLPAPFAPNSATMVPGLTSIRTPLTALMMP